MWQRLDYLVSVELIIRRHSPTITIFRKVSPGWEIKEGHELSLSFDPHRPWPPGSYRLQKSAWVPKAAPLLLSMLGGMHHHMPRTGRRAGAPHRWHVVSISRRLADEPRLTQTLLVARKQCTDYRFFVFSSKITSSMVFNWAPDF